ncbi:quinone oxidoreductase family protein [Sanguibacter sp. A247]|uniref:quinone oxidoreductase family protein n=1 Tax=unclassified Sanguibacter TaxID=2645534 RepID=UPI003FD7FEE1
MRALQAARPGGPDVLDLVEIPVPVPGPGDVLVDVVVAGVNFIDTYRRSGIYPSTFPHVPGVEGAGIVAALGPGVTDIAVGDRVAWFDAPGSYAEHVIVASARTLPVPDDIDLPTAAALGLQGLTAHYLATSSFTVGPGHDVLIHAGAGGVGLLLTQLVVARGGRVVATVSSAEKEALAREAGASDVVRYDLLDDITTELPRLVRDLVPHGVAAVYDGVGRATFDASLASLAVRGTLVLFGGSSGQVPPFDLQRLNSGGSLVVTRPTLSDHVRTRGELLERADALFGLAQIGALRTRLGLVVPLEDGAAAHAALEGRRTTGKVLLEVTADPERSRQLH